MKTSGVDLARQEALFLLQQYARKFHKGEISIPVPVEQIAEVHFGFIIERTELGGGISGQLFVADKRIVLNSSDPITRQRFTTGHELGHFCLHAGSGGVERCPTSFTRDKEREANYFAASLLLPTNLVLLELATEVHAADQMAKDEGRIYELTGRELHLIIARLANRFLVSNKTLEILLSRRFNIREPVQLHLDLGIETA